MILPRCWNRTRWPVPVRFKRVDSGGGFRLAFVWQERIEPAQSPRCCFRLHWKFATDCRPENAGDGRQRRTCRRQGGFIESWFFASMAQGLADSRPLLWLAPFLQHPGSATQTPRKKLWTGTRNEGQMRTFLETGNLGKVFRIQAMGSHARGLRVQLDAFCFAQPTCILSTRKMSAYKLVAIPSASTSVFGNNFCRSISTNFPTGPDGSLAMLGIKYDVFRKAGFDCDASRAGVAWCCLSLTRSCMCLY